VKVRVTTSALQVAKKLACCSGEQEPLQPLNGRS